MMSEALKNGNKVGGNGTMKNQFFLSLEHWGCF
jgi:hypothetical protein